MVMERTLDTATGARSHLHLYGNLEIAQLGKGKVLCSTGRVHDVDCPEDVVKSSTTKMGIHEQALRSLKAYVIDFVNKPLS
jgi:hypothetical protein